MPRISLDDFNGAVDAKFEDVEFDVTGNKVARFVQPLRLSKEKRAKLDVIAVKVERFDFKSEEDFRAASLELFELTARTKADFANMKRHLGTDTANHLVAIELLIQAYGGVLGGSLALGELLDEYGEELFLDLKQYWGFDLASYLGGEVFSSSRIILTLIRNLPEGSRYVAVRAQDVDQMPEDIQLSSSEQKRIDAITWNFDRRLLAMVVNSVNTNTVMTGGPWKGDGPKFPPIGPIEWDPDKQRKIKARERVETGNWTNWDVARALGLIDTGEIPDGQ